jgi:protein phosphatase 2C family protein 2/3
MENQESVVVIPSSSMSKVHLSDGLDSTPTTPNFRRRRLSFTASNNYSTSSILHSTPNSAKTKALSIIAELGFDQSQMTPVQKVQKTTGDGSMVNTIVSSEADDHHRSLSGNKRKICSPEQLCPQKKPSVVPICVDYPPTHPTRTLHAASLPIPKSPTVRRLSRLYHRNPSPHPKDVTYLNLNTLHQHERWKQRHCIDHEDGQVELSLPFPRDVAGLYSCYGIEPLRTTIFNNSPNSLSDTCDEDDDDESYSDVTSKINQDRAGIAYPYGNSLHSALFAVYDGHGDGGENVAQFSLHEVQRRLELHPDFHSNITRALKDTFLGVNRDLQKENTIEPYYSGSTACVVLLRSSILITANTGDSRAVIGRSNKGTYKPIDLSIDQNPDSPGEMERIINLGGFVSPPPEQGLSARVWLDQGYTKVGLAMSRSIGDYAVKSVGVIADPVVSTYKINERDEFMIIATDGVWEFISSQDAVNIVASSLKNGSGASGACQVLIEAAAAQWHQNEGNYRDDITAMVIHWKGMEKYLSLDSSS